MIDLLGLIMQNWPTVGLVCTLLIGVFLLARYWYSSELRDMRTRVDYLDEQVRALRYRDQCYFEYVLYVESYGQRLELMALARGYELEPRTPFLVFRDRWMRERGLQDEQNDIWQT